MKGWIRLNVLCDNEDTEMFEKLGINKNLKTSFKPYMLQISNIVSVPLEPREDLVNNRKGIVIGTDGVYATEENAKEILKLIEENQ